MHQKKFKDENFGHVVSNPLENQGERYKLDEQ
jgi:hypothetical protein